MGSTRVPAGPSTSGEGPALPGGGPVDRRWPEGIVADMPQRMRAARDAQRLLRLAAAPEGTRSLSAGWRSGFCQVAVGAVARRLAAVRGLHRERASPVQPGSS